MKRLLKKETVIFWGIPVVILVMIFLLGIGVFGKIQKNNVGKPEIITASSYGEVEEVLVSPGDKVQPGKVMLRYVMTDKNGNMGDKTSSDSSINVTLKKINTERFTEKIELPGIITAEYDTDIFSQVSGVVTNIYYRQGEKAQKGDILLSIDKKDYEIMLERAKASYDLAMSSYERAKKLKKENAISKSDMDNVEAQYRLSNAGLKNAEILLERCDIRAPFNGIVNILNTEVGELVNPGVELVNFIDISRVKITVGIPEQEINSVRGLKEVEFSVSSTGDKIYNGKVKNIGYSAGDVARVYPLEIIYENKDMLLLPGMIAKASVIKNIYENAVLIPLFSIIPGDSEYYTFISQNNKAVKKVIELGSLQGNNVHILSGIKPGDLIIEKGLRLVTDGTDINIIK